MSKDITNINFWNRFAGIYSAFMKKMGGILSTPTYVWEGVRMEHRQFKKIY